MKSGKRRDDDTGGDPGVCNACRNSPTHRRDHGIQLCQRRGVRGGAEPQPPGQQAEEELPPEGPNPFAPAAADPAEEAAEVAEEVELLHKRGVPECAQLLMLFPFRKRTQRTQRIFK